MINKLTILANWLWSVMFRPWLSVGCGRSAAGRLKHNGSVVAVVNVGRDGFKIALVRDGTTQYVDTYNLPAGRDCEYTISAYDFMANESERTAKVTVTVSTPNRAATNTDP